MADFERSVLDFYQLSSPYPSEWPAEKDEEETGTDDASWSHNQRASRYQALATAVNERRSLGPGSGGVNNVVQSDEPDPLGSSESVVRSLKNMGLPIQDDIRLRT
jgi:exocyst complex component 2